jgi:hypothetical protein
MEIQGFAYATLTTLRCYVDASTDPDQTNLTFRLAGQGIFILNFDDQRTQAIYIKAKL